MTYPVPYTWFISGKIAYLNGIPFTTGIIRAFHVCNGTLNYLGESGFNEDGSYQITYSSANFQNGDPSVQHPDVKIFVFDYQGNVLWESKNVMAFESQQTFSFIIDKEQEDNPGGDDPGNDNPGEDNPGEDIPLQEIWTVRGTVAYDNGQPLTGGAVKAFDYDSGLNYYLNSAVLKSDGTFEISYTKDSFQRGNLEKTVPNLLLHVYDLTGNLLQSFNVNYPPSMEENVSIVIMQSVPETNDNYVIYGRVLNRSGRPLKDVYVSALCLDFGKNQFNYYTLNQEPQITDENGYYKIVYSPLCLPRCIQEPSPDDPVKKVALFAKFFLNPNRELSVPSFWAREWNYSNLVLDASRQQEINFTIDAVSSPTCPKFDNLDNVLKVYLSAVKNEVVTDKDGSPVALWEDKISFFIDSSFKNVFPGFRERLNQDDVVAYFRAYELFYRIQRLRPDLIDLNRELFYASGLFVLCKKGLDSIAKLQSEKKAEYTRLFIGCQFTIFDFIYNREHY